MKFDLASDLHINHYSTFQWNKVTPSEVDTLIIAGDLSENLENNADFLREAKQHYKNVCYVDGNHDSYNTSRYLEDHLNVSQVEEYYTNASTKDSWTYLPSSDLILKDTVIIGANGWYSWNTGDSRYTEVDYRNAWKQYMSDSRLIKFDTIEPNGLAERDFKILFDKVLKYDKDNTVESIVIVTHTIPILEALTVKEEKTSVDVAWNLLGGSFLNHHMGELSLISNKVKIHVFGHTHFEHDLKQGNTRYICHPKGYPGEVHSTNYRFKTVDI